MSKQKKVPVELVMRETEELKRAVARELEETKLKTEAMIKKGLSEIIAKYIGEASEKD